MLASLSQAWKCLYCVWPALVAGIGFWLSKMVEGKTFYGSLTPGVDPASPQGQQEFETRRQRDGEKRRIIAWCVGIIICGYLAALLASTFTVKVKASAPTGTPSAAFSPTLTVSTSTLTPTSTPSQTGTLAPTLKTSTYLPTATARIIYVAGPKETVVVTVIVTKIVTAKPTKTPTPTLTPVPTLTETPTETPSETPTPTEPWIQPQ